VLDVEVSRGPRSSFYETFYTHSSALFYSRQISTEKTATVNGSAIRLKVPVTFREARRITHTAYFLEFATQTRVLEKMQRLV
jgi:hypothetical protein